MKSTGERIRFLRKRAGLTQKELGKQVGVSGPSVTQWEADSQIPKTDNAEQLSKILKSNWQWIRYGKGVPGAFEEKHQSRATWLSQESEASDTSNQIKLIEKADIGAYLSGESVKSELLPRELSAIKEYHHGSDRTFSYIEDVASIQSLIIPGETIVMVDPDAGISATGRGRHYLAKINDRYLIGYIEDTASGMMLNFDNRSPGWDAIAITPSDCTGRVLSAFERNWK